MTNREQTNAKRPIGETEVVEDWSLKGIVVFILGLLIVVAVAVPLMYWLTVSVRDRERELDADPPVLLEARLPHTPPAPNLQSAPFDEMAALREAEENVLTSYAWVDEANGIARIPIDRAIELVVEHGLPDNLEAAALEQEESRPE